MNLKDANKGYRITTQVEIVKAVDGDGLIVRNLQSKIEFEVRLYGMDAPELKPCKKLLQDERETHVPGQLLIKLGWLSFRFMSKIAKPGTKCTLIQENKNNIDKYGRQLAYVILPNGKSLNVIMIERGYAKPYDKIYCSELSKFKILNFEAKKKRKGLYSKVKFF
jgi:micrococcal nuclease